MTSQSTLCISSYERINGWIVSFVVYHFSVVVQFLCVRLDEVHIKHHDIYQSTLFNSYLSLAFQHQVFLLFLLLTMTLALPEGRVGHFQCGFCASFLIVDGRGCQRTRDSRGLHSDCDLEEVAWYKASYAMGNMRNPVATTAFSFMTIGKNSKTTRSWALRTTGTRYAKDAP